MLIKAIKANAFCSKLADKHVATIIEKMELLDPTAKTDFSMTCATPVRLTDCELNVEGRG